MSYLDPALPLLLLMAAGGWIALRQRFGNDLRVLLCGAGIIGLGLLSSPWFAVLLAAPLETWYPQEDARPVGIAEAIIVLSGSVDPPRPFRPYAEVGQDTYRRLQHALWLYRHWQKLPILVCGGPNGEAGQPLSSEMRRILEAEGVPADHILEDFRSRSTHENAVFGAELLKSHKLSRAVLVVEASSMLRASRAFEKQGIGIVPAPIRFTTLMYSWRDVLPDWRPIARNAETIHEMAGLLWYRWNGWI